MVANTVAAARDRRIKRLKLLEDLMSRNGQPDRLGAIFGHFIEFWALATPEQARH
jgi:hypothetical protein